MTKDEAIKLALDVITEPHPGIRTNLSDAMIYREKVKTTIEALRTALEQPEQDLRRKRRLEKVQDAICANLMAVNSNSVEFQPIKTQPGPESVAYGVLDEDGQIDWTCDYPFSNTPGWPDSVPLYTAPPQRKPLTDDRISEILNTWDNADGTIASLCRSIEAAHGIKD